MDQASYLTRLRGELAGQLPSEQAEVLLEEAAFILERMELDGRGSERLEEPHRLARIHIQGVYEIGASSALIRAIGRSNSTALAAFGLAQLAYIIFLQLQVFAPSQAAVHLPFSPAQVRSVLPNPIPFPELSVRYIFQIGFPIVAPLAAGWAVGRLVPAGAGLAVARILPPLILATFTLGSLHLPNTDALLFALLQTAHWIPSGILTASLTSHLARRRRSKTARGAA